MENKKAEGNVGDSADNEKESSEQKDSLREFVTKECQQQLQSHGDHVSDGIGQERMNQFFQRAISESERMNAEVSKSRAQQQKLYDELGKDMFESWSKDHASQVLTPEQYQSWKKEEEKSRNDFLCQKMLHSKVNDEDSFRYHFLP